MAVRFTPAPAPDLEEFGVREHVFSRNLDGRVMFCARCNLPRRNRIHVTATEEERQWWHRRDAARLGERD